VGRAAPKPKRGLCGGLKAENPNGKKFDVSVGGGPLVAGAKGEMVHFA